MAPVVKSKINPQDRPRQPRVLVVDDEPDLVELVQDVGRDLGCTVITATDIAAAEKILALQPVELLVADLHLPDGDGMALLPSLREQHPTAAAIVITGDPSLDGAVGAIRSGAVDFIAKPFTVTQIAQRISKALERQAVVAKQEKRVEKLRVAVRRLNEARRLVGKKVDLLCNDLVTAYGDLSRQFDGVRNQESFRKTADSAKDLEQLLCHAMDWLLRELGYSNVAVWLADEEGDFQLGAYMKYTVPGEPALTDALKRVILPMAAKESFVRLTAEDLKETLSADELNRLKGQEIIAANCTYLGDSLAAIVFFRDARGGFSDDDCELLKSISPIFAVSLATVVRGAEDDDSDEDQGPFLDKRPSETAGGLDEPDEPAPKPKSPQKPKTDPADWWRRGEAPPF